MRKIIVCAFIFGAVFASPAAAQSASPEFWAQITDSGQRLEVFASSNRDSKFRCSLNVGYETADGVQGSFRCKANVYGKTREAMVCSTRINGDRITSIGRINKSCSLN